MKTIEVDWDGEKYIAWLFDEEGWRLGVKDHQFGEGLSVEQAIGDLLRTGDINEFTGIKVLISCIKPDGAC